MREKGVERLQPLQVQPHPQFANHVGEIFNRKCEVFIQLVAALAN